MKDIKKSKLFIVLIIVVALTLGAIILKCLSKPNNKYIILDDYIIEYNTDSIKEASYEDAKGYNFRLLHSNEYIGNYTFDHIDGDINRLYFKNSDGINMISAPLLGLDDNTDIIEYNTENMTEEDFALYKSLVERNVNYNLSDLSIANKITIDNKDINIYVVKYEGKEEIEDYSMIFVSNGKGSVVLDEDYPHKDDGGYNFYSFNVEYIIDLNHDNKYELVVSKSHYDITDYSIYSLEDSFQELYYTGV